jgi:beta-galactosidase
MDMCGFPKDAFFLHKAFFTSERFIHLFPHWNWPGHEGQPIIVFAYTNQPWVELFLNGQSFGKQRVNSTCTAMWTVPYQPGTLNAVAYDTEKGEQSATDTVRTSGPATALVLEIHSSFDATTIPADGAFAIPITVFAVDAEGAPVPTADNLVAFSIKGPAKILGVGNGNPTCHEPDKASERSLFNGLAQIIIQTAKPPGGIELTATTDGLKSATLRFDSTQSLNRPSVPAARPRYLVTGWRMSPISSDRPDVTQPAMEQDVNSWDRIDPAAGPQEAWKRASGYAIYRAEAKPPKILKATGGQIVFHEIVGQADVYLDGVAVATKSDPRAGQIVVPIPSGLDRITLSAILHATTCPAGITQCVEILEPGK